MKLEELDDKAIEYILDNAVLERMTDWERNFFESVSEQWTRNHRLSDKQKEVLGNIWDKQP